MVESEDGARAEVEFVPLRAENGGGFCGGEVF